MEEKEKRSWTEEIEITANELVDRVKGLIEEGNVRRLIIRKADGDILLEVPLTAGVAVGGAVTIIAPVLAALGAMAALLVKVRLDIVRSDEKKEDEEEDEEEAAEGEDKE